MKMLKYRAKGSDVVAVEVTAENVDEVAALVGGTSFISPRTDQPYVLVETPNGSARADLGAFVVQGGTEDQPTFQVFSAEEMATRYERP